MVQIIMIIKLAEDMYVNIESVNARLNDHTDKKARDASTAIQVIYG